MTRRSSRQRSRRLCVSHAYPGRAGPKGSGCNLQRLVEGEKATRVFLGGISEAGSRFEEEGLAVIGAGNVDRATPLRRLAAGALDVDRLKMTFEMRLGVQVCFGPLDVSARPLQVGLSFLMLSKRRPGC